MQELTVILSKELGKLINDYYRYSDPEIKKQTKHTFSYIYINWKRSGYFGLYENTSRRIFGGIIHEDWCLPTSTQ